MAKHTAEQASPPKPDKSEKSSRPKKVLPSDRIRFEKQLDILKAYASVCVNGAGVSVKPVAELVDMNESTIYLANSFLADAGLIVKGSGGFAPAPEVAEYKRALEFTPDIAGHRLAPVLSKAWFFACLRPKLEFKTLSDDEAVGELGVESGAGTKHRQQLRLLLEYLATAGLIQRENGQVKLGPRRVGEPQVTQPPPSDPSKGTPKTSGVTGGMAPGDGTINYHIDIQVSIAEMHSWQPDRIAAFFAGMAQVIAAKAQCEEASTR